jgi:hypothetical protein
MFRPEERLGFFASLRVLPGIIAVRTVLLFWSIQQRKYLEQFDYTGGQGRSSERIVRLHRHGKLDLLPQFAEDRCQPVAREVANIHGANAGNIGTAAAGCLSARRDSGQR